MAGEDQLGSGVAARSPARAMAEARPRSPLASLASAAGARQLMSPGKCTTWAAGPRGKDTIPSPGRWLEHGLEALRRVLLSGREVVLVEQVKNGYPAVRAAQLLPHRFG